MPGLYTHMAFAKRINEKVEMNNEELMIGSVAADVCYRKNKMESHFGTRIVKASPEQFYEKYQEEVQTPFGLGYLSHLYLDSVFYDRLISKNYQLLEGKSYIDGQAVFLDKRLNQVKTFQEVYFGDNIYRDYALTNYDLCRDYHIQYFYPTENIKETKIVEIDDKKIPEINQQLEMYKPEKIEGRTHCFEYFQLKDFLEESCENFIQKYIK